MKQPTPDFKVTLDGTDLTSVIEPRLQSLSISECRQDEADTLDITLDDHDGLLAIPRRGALLSVSIGWEGAALVNKGTFTVDEIEHSGAPDVITIRARSASMTKNMGERQEKSWHGKTLESIVSTIASKHKLKPIIGAALGKITIAHIDQTHESDMSFLNRLSKRYDAVMTVKDSRLLFVPIGEARSASGQEFKVIALTRRSGDQHRYHVAERENYAGVKAHWHDNTDGKRKSVIIGGENQHNIKVLPEVYPNEPAAKAAATAEMNRTQRSQATMAFTLALGRPDILPEFPVTLTGFKPQIDDTAWLVKRARHSISEGGFTTSLELEMRDDPTSDRHRDNFRKGGG